MPDIRKAIPLEAMPPYSPDLNPYRTSLENNSLRENT